MPAREALFSRRLVELRDATRARLIETGHTKEGRTPPYVHGVRVSEKDQLHLHTAGWHVLC
ncbi:MAG: hypothetical protein ACXVIB_02030 [Halobacteriota archaeon]